MSIETVIHKISSDPAFAKSMALDPAATLEEHGMVLPPEELNALQSALGAMDSETISGATDEPNDWFAPQFMGATDEPNDWFAPQFSDATDEPNDWFAPPFHNEIA